QALDLAEARERQEGDGPLRLRPGAAAVPKRADGGRGQLGLEGNGRLLVDGADRLVPAVPAPDRLLDLPDEPGAGGRLEGDELRQIAREADGAGLAEDRLQGRRGR